VNEQVKQEAIELAYEANNMIDPRIIISPVLTLTIDEWKRVLVAFLELKTAISNKLNNSITLNILDANDDISESLINIDLAEDEELDQY
jgi:hypothetical protein